VRTFVRVCAKAAVGHGTAAPADTDTNMNARLSIIRSPET